jgi:phosphatidylglycerophosphate synthase
MLQPFWDACARRLPPWLAPNVLTVLGVVVVAVPTAIAIHAAPSLRGPIPAWMIVAQVLGVFAFQTLDAIDGKQARRTGSSSPLGSFLDHALDILTMQLVFAGVALSLQLGDGLPLWLLLGGTLVNNYFLHWETRRTGELVLGNGTSITDAQALAMGLHLVTLVVGFEFWRAPLFGSWSRGEVLLVAATFVVGGAGLLASLVRGVAGARRKAEGLVAYARLTVPVVYFASATTLLLTIHGAHARLLVIAGCAAIGVRLVGDVVLANLSDEEASPVPVGLLAVTAVTIASATHAVPERTLGACTAAIGAALLFGWLVQTTRGLARRLGISIFTLGKVGALAPEGS